MVCGMPYSETKEIWNQSKALPQTSCAIFSMSLEPRFFMVALWFSPALFQWEQGTKMSLRVSINLLGPRCWRDLGTKRDMKAALLAERWRRPRYPAILTPRVWFLRDLGVTLQRSFGNQCPLESVFPLENKRQSIYLLHRNTARVNSIKKNGLLQAKKWTQKADQ